MNVLLYDGRRLEKERDLQLGAAVWYGLKLASISCTFPLRPRYYPFLQQNP
jgi:hypothetical protein